MLDHYLSGAECTFKIKEFKSEEKNMVGSYLVGKISDPLVAFVFNDKIIIITKDGQIHEYARSSP